MAGEANNKEFQELMIAIKGLTTSFNSFVSKPSTAGGEVEKTPGQKQTAQFEKDLTESVKYFGKGIAGAFSKMQTNLKKDFDQIGTDTFADILISHQKRTGSEMAARTNAYMKGVVVLIGDSAKTAATAFAGAMIQFNKLFNDMWGGVESAMKGIKDMAMKGFEGLGIGGGPVGSAISGFLDTLIKSIMFKFEDGLKFRDIKREAEVQLGFGDEAAVSFATNARKYFSALTKGVATEWGKAFATAGITDTGAYNKMMGIGVSLGLGADATAKLTQNVVALGNTAGQAASKIEDTYRKLQESAKKTGLPTKMMGDYIMQAATNARFLNVDLGQVVNMMVNLQKKSQDLSKVGVDFRLSGATIAKELSSGGKEISDAMHVFFGSEGGMKDISTGMAWARSKFGGGVAESIQGGGGGFTATGDMSKDAMMGKRLETMKELMVKAASVSQDPREQLLIQTKMAKQLGLSDATATTMAMHTQEGIAKLAEDPEMANAFETTDAILSKMQTSAAKSEALQRELVRINLAMAKLLFEIPIFIVGWFQQKLGVGEESKKLYKSSMKAMGEQTDELGDATSRVAKILGTMAPAEDVNYFGNRIKAVKSSFGSDEDVSDIKDRGKNLKKTLEKTGYKWKGNTINKEEDKAVGGPVSSGHLYSVGEGNKPELLMIPGNNGEVIPSDKVDKLAAAGSAGASGSGGISINLAIHGVTKDQIMQQITNEVLRALQ